MSRPYTQIAKKYIFNSQNWLEQPDGYPIFSKFFNFNKKKVCDQNSSEDEFQLKFLKNTTTVCSSEKILTGEVDKYHNALYLCTLFHSFLNFTFRNFVSVANSCLHS